jgi:hypothetical protein
MSPSHRSAKFTVRSTLHIITPAEVIRHEKVIAATSSSVAIMRKSTAVKSAPQCDHVFEFSDNVAVMRFIRAFLYLQIVGIIIDNTYVELPVLFRTFCRDLLFYVIRFYSRPFIDAIYIFDSYRSKIIRGAASVFTHGRSLSTHDRILSDTSR